MLNEDKDLKRAIASVDFIKAKLVPGVSVDNEVLITLKAETLYLLGVILGWRNVNCANSSKVNWLEGYTFDFSKIDPLLRPAYLWWERLYLQSALDSLDPDAYPRYKIVQLDFYETSPGSGIYTAEAYLCPPAQKPPPGPNSSFDPPQPPHNP